MVEVVGVTVMLLAHVEEPFLISTYHPEGKEEPACGRVYAIAAAFVPTTSLARSPVSNVYEVPVWVLMAEALRTVPDVVIAATEPPCTVSTPNPPDPSTLRTEPPPGAPVQDVLPSSFFVHNAFEVESM
jgi:hypothetical protein